MRGAEGYTSDVLLVGRGGLLRDGLGGRSVCRCGGLPGKRGQRRGRGLHRLLLLLPGRRRVWRRMEEKGWSCRCLDGEGFPPGRMEERESFEEQMGMGRGA